MCPSWQRLIFFSFCAYLLTTNAFAISIEGRVVNSETNEPIAQADVKLTCQEEQRWGRYCKELSGKTAFDGNFHLDRVLPFLYRLSTTGAPGMVVTRWSQLDVDLTTHTSKSEAVLKLAPEGGITGKVLDEAGQPKAAVVVEAYRQFVTGARTQVTFVSKAITNDNGVYVLRSLLAGNYYVATPLPHEDKNDSTHPYLFFAPNTLGLDQASVTHVDNGRIASSVDLHLRPVSFFRLQGRAQMETVGSVASDPPQLHLDARDSSGASLPGREIILNSDGSFQTDVLPGSYTFRLTGALTLPQSKSVRKAASGPTVHLLAKSDIEVSGKDLLGLIVLIPPPITVTGRAYLEGTNEPNLLRGSVTLRPVEADAIGGYLSADLQTDGSFVIANCDPANYAVRFTPPSGTYVKSIGFNNHDITTQTLDLSRGYGGELTIVIRSGAASLSGTVLDSGVSEASGSQKSFEVTLVPDLWNENGLAPVRHASSKDGRFTLSGIAPGHYVAIATSGVDSHIWENAQFVHEMQSRGIMVDLAENDRQQLAVPFLTFDELDQLQTRLGINYE